MSLRSLAAGLTGLVVLWFVFWSVDVHHERRTKLSEHLTLVERVQVERSAFSLGGGDGGFFVLPIPSREERVVGQRVVRGGTTVWSGGVGGWANRDVDVFASPDERLLVLQSRIRQEPLVIHRLDGGAEISIPEPEAVRANEHSGYEPRFFGWSADSRYLYMATQEADFSDNVDERWFRSIWQVDVRDGRTTLDRRCEDRFPHNPDRGPDWSATVCADTMAPLVRIDNIRER
jgi:hypothetical protein